MMRTREYFQDKILEGGADSLFCPCCGQKPNKESLERLYALRILHGKPIYVISGARCQIHNDKLIKVARSSAHLKGGAFDIRTTRDTEGELIKLALLVGFNGIGIKNNRMLHIDDTRDSLTIWTY